MSASSNKKRSAAGISSVISLRFLIVSVFVFIFSAVYEMFSHGVYSYFMILAFLIPLCGGCLPFAAAAVCERHGSFSGFFSRFSGFALQLYESGLACFTAGSLFRGILEIYGTTNRLTVVYPVSGAVLVIVGLVLGILELRSGKSPADQNT